jgi:D-glycero-D-manno-heptose 1,7-bisphosphate phosphatase
MSSSIRSRLVLLDRDGTLNVERDHLTEPDQVELVPGAAAGVRLLTDLGLRVIVVSNQSAIGRGWLTEEVLDRIHARLSELLSAEGASVDAFFVCPHRPEEGCECRKPAPGLAVQAATHYTGDLSSSFVVGDQASDIELGHRIGATSILVRTGYGMQYVAPSSPLATPDHCVADLRAAAELIRSLVTPP